MALDSESDWKTAWADVPLVPDASWKANLALFLSDLTSGKLKLSTIFSAPGTGAGDFTFNAATFQGALSGNSASVLADAWEAGVGASVMNVAASAFVGSDSPATKFSVVTTAIIDPASIAAGKAIVMSLASIPLTDDVLDSQFASKMRLAFLSLTVTVTGINSVVPPAGPNPLIAAAGAVS